VQDQDVATTRLARRRKVPRVSAISPERADDEQLLLVREYRHGVGAALTRLPGRLVDAGDGPRGAAAAARRELREETGHEGKSWRLLLTTFPNPSHQNNTAHVFLATGARPTSDRAHEASIEVMQADFVAVLDSLRTGALRWHAIHDAALWSAAAAIGSFQQNALLSTLPARLRATLAADPLARADPGRKSARHGQ